jgi:hypothetical protein
MKRTCHRCCAFGGAHLDGRFRCDLNFKIRGKYNPRNGITSPVPTEKCPKPLTIGKYFQLQKIRAEAVEASR